MAASTSSIRTDFNVVESESLDNTVGVVGNESVEAVDETRYGFYWIALIVLVAVVYVFWKLSKKKSKKRSRKKKK
jgi:cytochrome oxidase assembly protein ShyY1